jgi:DHA2 family multidrug resistance protein
VLEEGQTDDWFESAFIRNFAVIAVVAMALFIWRELTAKAPVVDLRVLRYRSVWAGSCLSVVIGMALYGALFAVPIFAQTIMHYTAQQTGMLLLPGALASAVAFPLAARLMGKMDPRLLLGAGALVLAGAVIALGRLSPSTGADDLFWPLIVRSFGTVMMFLPLSLATLGPVPKKDLPGASAFFNLTRQLGGSVGVALLTTLLARRNAWHRTVLVEKLVAGSVGVEQRVQQMAAGLGGGLDPAAAKQRALTALSGIVNQQASVLSFGDTFWATAVLIFCTLPLILLLGKPARGAEAISGGH